MSLSNSSLTTEATRSMSLVTPVLVSLWVTRTADISGSASRTRRSSSTSTAVPWGKFTIVTSAPNISAILPKRSPNEPMDAHTTFSPGERVLTTAASIAPVPDEVRMNTSFLVRNTCRSPSVTRRSMSLKRGPRWFIIWVDILSRMSSGTGMGPGIRRFVIGSP